MKRKYPRANNCLIYSKKANGTYLTEDIESNEEWELDASTVNFLRRLDGKTPPSCICPKMSDSERREFIHELKTEGLIKKTKRFYMDGLFFWRFTPWIPGRSYPRKVAAVVNMILLLLLPGAYVIMDEKNVKRTVRRIQIYAAGVEANLMLTGICLFLAAVVPPLFWMFSQAALSNGFLAVFNLSVMGGLDGMKIFSEVMGSRDLLETVLDVLLPDGGEKQVLMWGINGCALKIASVVVLLFHLAFVCTIIMNIAVFLIDL